MNDIGSIVKFNAKKKPMIHDEFVEVLGAIKELFLRGDIKDVLIIVDTKEDGKYCASNNMLVDDAVDMCKDFVRNTKEYLD